MLVVQELWETETAGVLAAARASIPKTIQTEVLLLPAAYFMEKEGTDHRLRRALVQWRYAAREAARAGADRTSTILDEVFRRVRDALPRARRDPKDAADPQGGLELPEGGARRGRC